MSMQKRRKLSVWFFSFGGGKEMTKVEQQAQAVKLSQHVARIVPLFYEIGAVWSWRKKCCNVAAVSSLNRKYPDVNCSSRIAIPVNSASDARSTLSGGRSRISPSPSKNAPVIRPQMSSVNATVPLSKSRWRVGLSIDASRMRYTRCGSSPRNESVSRVNWWFADT